MHTHTHTANTFKFTLQPMTNLISIPPNQLNTSPQTISSQVLQKQQQQLRSMHPNMLAQQQHIINATNVHQVEFRHPNSANVILQQNQMQQFQPVSGAKTNRHQITIKLNTFLYNFGLIHFYCSSNSLRNSK